MNRSSFRYAVCALAACTAAPAFGLTLAEYQFGVPGTPTLNATSSADGVTAGAATNNTLSQLITNTLGYATQPVIQTNPANNANTGGGSVLDRVNRAFDNGDFFSLSLTADEPDQIIRITGISLDVGRGGTGSDRGYGIRSSVTGTTSLGSTGGSNGNPITTRPNFFSASHDTSNLLVVSQPGGSIDLSFSVATDGSGQSIEWDNIVVQGNVVKELVRYNFDTTQSNVASNVAPTSVVNGIRNDSSLNMNRAGTGLNTFEVSNQTPAYATLPTLRVTSAASTTLADAITNDSYFDFSIAPDGAHSLSLDSFIFDAGRGGSSTERGWALFSSLDGFTDALGLDETIDGQRPNFTTYLVDLTDSAFQGLTDEVTFRMYVFANSNGSSIEFDNMRFLGNLTPVPEPTSIVLIGLAGAALLRRRRHA